MKKILLARQKVTGYSPQYLPGVMALATTIYLTFQDAKGQQFEIKLDKATAAVLGSELIAAAAKVGERI